MPATSRRAGASALRCVSGSAGSPSKVVVAVNPLHRDRLGEIGHRVVSEPDPAFMLAELGHGGDGVGQLRVHAAGHRG